LYSLSLEALVLLGASWVRVYLMEIGDLGFERKPEGESLYTTYQFIQLYSIF